MLRNRDNSSKGLDRILSPLGRYLDHHPAIIRPRSLRECRPPIPPAMPIISTFCDWSRR
jgi:hypothetical protein